MSYLKKLFRFCQRLLTKRVKYALIAFGIVYAIFVACILSIRMPSYTIKTSGKLYIVSKVSRDTQVFNLETGKEIADIPLGILSHESVTTANRNMVIATNSEAAEGNSIKVINTATNTVEKSIDLKGDVRVMGIVALPAPDKVAVVDFVGNNLLVVNVANDSIEKQIATQQKESHLLVLHPKKEIAYVTNIASGSISVIDLERDEVIKIIAVGVGRKGLDITPDGTELWVSNTNIDVVKVIDTNTYEVIKTIGTGEEPLKLKFTNNGKQCLLTNAIEGTIAVYDTASKEKIKTIVLHGKTTLLERILYHTPRPVNILMHPNGQYAFIANSNANKVEVLDMNSFEIVSTIGTGKVPDALVFVE